MATSLYFQKNRFSEQRLLEDLTIESIKINGIDAYYLPRTLFNQDQIFEEDILSTFNRGYFIEMYVKEVEGFSGEKELLSKFGVEVRERVTFALARRRFEDEIGVYESRTRPLEGDLIYFPINGGLYEIKFVDHDIPFYQISERFVYELRCEKFEYSSERIDTGISEIDKIEDDYSLSNTGTVELLTDSYNVITTAIGEPIILSYTSLEDVDPGSQNEELQIGSDAILDFTESNPFGDRV